ncbi:hypothetical protein LSH36_1773g00000 [Paralvinella palmiformis]|uniref:Uncharacterized protein n=1 Tax=Paralvinella palmiformis TaxID=53620 RepID=A0AAD9MMZ4_9ANNE|nr:hypothetical protein LSH36_1773g00000 [Paralvinella palmiformis]
MASIYTIYLLILIGHTLLTDATNKLGISQARQNEIPSRRRFICKDKETISSHGIEAKYLQRRQQVPIFNVIKCANEKITTLESHDRRNNVLSKGARDVNTILSQYDRQGRQRYRRHKHSKRNKDTKITNKQKHHATKHHLETKHRHGYIFNKDPDSVGTLPHEAETCTVITDFLSNGTSLKYIRQKAKELICEKGELYRKFHALEHLGNVDFKHESHRARIMKKWRHLACQLYQRFVGCLKETSSFTNYVPLPEDAAHNTPSNMGKTETLFTSCTDKEAVHVSDSSHVDFLNLMIGHDTEWTDDDQMWFY